MTSSTSAPPPASPCSSAHEQRLARAPPRMEVAVGAVLADVDVQVAVRRAVVGVRVTVEMHGTAGAEQHVAAEQDQHQRHHRVHGPLEGRARSPP